MECFLKKKEVERLRGNRERSSVLGIGSWGSNAGAYAGGGGGGVKPPFAFLMCVFWRKPPPPPPLVFFFNYANG